MTDRLTIDPAPMPAMTPELLAAMRKAVSDAEAMPLSWFAAAELLQAIRAAPGILAPAPPRAPVPDALWAGADAFAEDEA